MKVLLIIPTSGYPLYPNTLAASDFPIGFAYIAAALKKAGHQVIGLNPNNNFSYISAYEMVNSMIINKLKTHKPDVVCLGGICTEYHFIKDAIAIVKKNAPKTPIICGGGIITNDAEYIFDILGADFCVIGEGEEVIVKLLDAIDANDSNFDLVDNIGYRLNGKAMFTKRNYSFPDINSRAFPDYEPFNFDLLLDNSELSFDRNLYRYPRPDNPRVMPIVTARGCPFNCSFCVHDDKTKYRTRSIANILEEIKVKYERYHFNVLIIVDELFAANKMRLKEFCEGIIEGRRNHGWDFNWLFQTHANAALDKESLKMSKSAGCYFFSYGIESASPKVLQSMNKHSKPEQISEAIKLAQEVGIGFGGNYIFGDPAETIETIEESLNFIHLNSEYQNFMVFFGIVQPYPGSKIYKYCLEKGLIKDRLSLYQDASKPINMTQIPDDIFFPLVKRIDSIGQTMIIGDTELIKHVRGKKFSVFSTGTQTPLGKTPNLIKSLIALLKNGNRTQTLLALVRIHIVKRKLILCEVVCPYCGSQISRIEPLNYSFITPFIRLGCPNCNGQMILNAEKAFFRLYIILGKILFNNGKRLKRIFIQRTSQTIAGNKKESDADIGKGLKKIFNPRASRIISGNDLGSDVNIVCQNNTIKIVTSQCHKVKDKSQTNGIAGSLRGES